MVLVKSGWTMFSVQELSQLSSDVVPIHWVTTTVDILKMLVSDVLDQLAHEEPSDSKEALALKDVLKSATIMIGAQCVMTPGVHLMLKLHADNWDSLQQVSIFFPDLQNANQFTIIFFTYWF